MINQIVLHTCCADCLLNFIKYLEEEDLVNRSTKIISFFYNPNIQPRSEYLERLNAVKKVISEQLKDRDIQLVIPEYRPKEFFENIKGKNNRCDICWELRIKKTFEYAKSQNVPFVSTTLLSSHYQDREEIIKIGEKEESEDTKFVYPQKPHEQLKTSGFYKQNFCGCCYSLTQRMWEKYIKEN